jgi:biopolymer transport protein ExbB
MKRMMRATLLALVLAGSLAAPLAALAQTPPATPDAAAPAAPKKKTLLDLYVIGGWAMHPLLLCSMGIVAISVLNFRSMNRKVLIPTDSVAAIKQAASTGDLGKVIELAQAKDSLFTNSLAAGLRHLDPDDPVASKPKVDDAIAESMGRQESQHAFWLNFLSLITAIAPMFGLLGTVSGMIKAFDKIGMGGMGKPELLATNIGEAMITTAAGLLVAIPAMVAYFLFRNYLNKLLTEAEDHLTATVDELMNPSAAAE